MKRILVFLLLIAVAFTITADADDFVIDTGAMANAPLPMLLHIAPNDATNPQTTSFFTRYNQYCISWTAVAVGSDVILKIHGAGGTHPYWWCRIPAGSTFTSPEHFSPLDTVIVQRASTTGGLEIIGRGTK